MNGIFGAHALIGGVAYACLAWWRREGFGAADGVPAVTLLTSALTVLLCLLGVAGLREA